MSNVTQKVHDEAADSPVAWFAVLERTKQTGDFATAARAAARLRYVSLRIGHWQPFLFDVVGRLPRPPPVRDVGRVRTRPSGPRKQGRRLPKTPAKQPDNGNDHETNLNDWANHQVKRRDDDKTRRKNKRTASDSNKRIAAPLSVKGLQEVVSNT
jgi:hypothetical protein